ncbi:hypothetical protein GWK53_26210 [Burkholderia cepacia]|uniref:DUF6602 domain-containing protein n=1 Tax=Burkholderia cepacia TaxID=292 RepID=UPI0013F4AE77|nr:DUF6602 domain-containing protein [Burkholderia cepacia]NHB09977.1 hypothetical protein [Burkholderia cepacia]
MADKNQYQKFLRAKIKGAVEEARAASTLSHQGVKGTVLEILISKLFRPLLPSDVGVGTGQIIEQHGGTMSNQMDIILYDRSILPPALYDDSVGIFPIEAVLYAIEVKTTLTYSDLSRAHDAAAQLYKFRYLPGLQDVGGNNVHHSIERVRSVVFALNSDLSGNDSNEASRYEKIYTQKNDIPHLRAICVAGREYWYDDGEHWIRCPVGMEFDEVLGFIGGVTNTYRNVARSRHYPALGNYIVPSGTTSQGPQTGKLIRINLICENCKKHISSKPYSPDIQNLTVNGQLRYNNSCPDCNGTMTSTLGHYEFKKGLLQVAWEYPTIKSED